MSGVDGLSDKLVFRLFAGGGGNQRELARKRNQAKQKELQKNSSAKDKGGNKGLTLQERRERDAAALRAKTEKKKAQEQQTQ
ncbi:unnamed protein product [Rodentolepis nana]|uniref:4F5 domain-containing protein n=1 Tax=Rodentolepis nana TaxID=102285 RepID=A0A0R3T9E2_RODNA|nr:unnamed protein product [Rodentolepis nana]